MRAARLFAALPALAVALAAAGCGGAGFSVAAVEGVLLDKKGNPLPNVYVRFLPEPAANPGPQAEGTTDAEGRFTLAINDASSGFVGPGAVVGQNRVTLIDAERKPAAQGTKQAPARFSDKYAEPNLTPLKHTVMTGDNKGVQVKLPW